MKYKRREIQFLIKMQITPLSEDQIWQYELGFDQEKNLAPKSCLHTDQCGKIVKVKTQSVHSVYV